jgi:chromosome segregation ATPase
MADEQFQKRMDWLDEERRKDKTEIASLDERVKSLESSLNTANKLVQELSGELAHVRTVLGRIDSFESSLTQARTESKRSIEELDRIRKDRESELEDLRKVQFDSVHKQLNDLRKELEQFPGIHDQLANRSDEDARLNRKLDELKAAISEVERDDEDVTRSIRLIEEARRRDEKRLTDLQGEALALRKRADEQRGKLDLAVDGLRKVENRVAEISTVEVERREAYNQFVEKQSLAQVDRDRKWNEWQSRFETIENQAMEFETRVQELHTTQRDVRRAQETVEAISERVERRISEITELQRLGEDRFRQEWTTFKADDQKRWTNYTLTQEEQIREASRSQGRVAERLTGIEERVLHIEDLIGQVNEQTEHRLQRLLAVVREWTAEYEQVFGTNSR